jgi:hypothetical protein
MSCFMAVKSTCSSHGMFSFFHPPCHAHLTVLRTIVQRWITGYGPAIHCGFPSVEMAEAALMYARLKGWTSDTTPNSATSSNELNSLRFTSYAANPLNTPFPGDTWYAVCRGVQPGVYRL